MTVASPAFEALLTHLKAARVDHRMAQVGVPDYLEDLDYLEVHPAMFGVTRGRRWRPSTAEDGRSRYGSSVRRAARRRRRAERSGSVHGGATGTAREAFALPRAVTRFRMTFVGPYPDTAVLHG
jgi:hypothetical protein